MKLFEEAIKQALKFFRCGPRPSQMAKGAEKVMKVAVKIAKKGK